MDTESEEVTITRGRLILRIKSDLIPPTSGTISLRLSVNTFQTEVKMINTSDKIDASPHHETRAPRSCVRFGHI